MKTLIHQGTHSDSNRAALAALFRRQRVWVTERGAPVSSSDRKDAQLGDYDGGADGSRHFFGGLDAEADVAFGVADDDDGFESGALTGTGLLLYGLDLESHQWPSKQSFVSSFELSPVSLIEKVGLTFITSSFSLGRKKSTIWYSLMGNECR